MGHNLWFVAFRQKPDISKLQKIDWLTDWRLFEEAAHSAWHLEGQAEDQAATFHKEVRTSGVPQSSEVERLLFEINPKIDALGSILGSHLKVGLKESLIKVLLISDVLRQAVIEAFGNDEDDDFALVCDSGKFVRARFAVEFGIVTVDGENLDVSIKRSYEEGEAPDAIPGREIYEAITEEITLFFDADRVWPVTSDPYELDDREFKLVAQKGKPLVLAETPGELARNSAMEAIGNPYSGGKFPSKAFMNFIQPDLTEALHPSLILAELSVVEFYELTISSYAKYAAEFAEHGSTGTQKSAERIANFLWDVSGFYLRGLRPRPQFRKSSYDYPAYNRGLKRRWMVLKFRYLAF